MPVKPYAAIAYVLEKYSILIADAVAASRQLKRRQRIEEAGGQPSQATVPKASVLLQLSQVFQAITEIA
jgi:hypothetical protein